MCFNRWQGEPDKMRAANSEDTIQATDEAPGTVAMHGRPAHDARERLRRVFTLIFTAVLHTKFGGALRDDVVGLMDAL